MPHFPRHVLEQSGGWDPFNVTEDADLGIRLARQGGRIVVLGSTTMEEAPDCIRTWLPQRTRWLKGWIQSYLVHMRRPVKLLQDLGPWRFLGFQLLIGGFLLSAFFHPLFYVFLAIELTRAKPFQAGHSHTELVFWHLALFNLAAGYLASILLAALTTRRRGWRRLARHTLLMPVYWIFVSCAAYRALGQLLTAPHLWEKTRHHARTSALWRHHRQHRRAKSTPAKAPRRTMVSAVKRPLPRKTQGVRPGTRYQNRSRTIGPS
jgi:hypothetical protein